MSYYYYWYCSFNVVNKYMCVVISCFMLLFIYLFVWFTHQIISCSSKIIYFKVSDQEFTLQFTHLRLLSLRFLTKDYTLQLLTNLRLLSLRFMTKDCTLIYPPKINILNVHDQEFYLAIYPSKIIIFNGHDQEFFL